MSFHLQKCGHGVCHGIESFRSLRVAATSRAKVVSETMGCPSRGHRQPLRDYVSGSLVRTPCRRSLSVIDERHFCNDSPTCDFRCLGGKRKGGREKEGGSHGGGKSEVAGTFKRRRPRNIRKIDNSTVILRQATLARRRGNDDDVVPYRFPAYALVCPYKLLLSLVRLSDTRT